MNSGILTKPIIICLAVCITVPASAQMTLGIGNQELDQQLSIVYNLQRVGKFDNALKYLDQLSEKYGTTPQITSLYKSIYMMRHT